MPDFTVRSDSINVEQLMEQIRARIHEKRGVDYTEQQIRELAAVKLEKFLDPKAVRSDLLQQFQKMQVSQAGAANVTFGPNAIFEAKRPIIARIRGWLRPVLRLFLNPDPISEALVRLNDIDPRSDMYYELFHNLVIELTRTSIEVKNLKMRVESLTGRLEFNERRARALESVVVYRPEEAPQGAQGAQGSLSSQGIQGSGSQGPRGQERHRGSDNYGARGGQGHSGQQVRSPQAPQQSGPPAATSDAPAPPVSGGQPAEGPGQRSRRRRRRRGRRGGSGSAAALMGAQGSPNPSAPGEAENQTPVHAENSSDESGAFESDSMADTEPGSPGDPESNEP